MKQVEDYLKGNINFDYFILSIQWVTLIHICRSKNIHWITRVVSLYPLTKDLGLENFVQ